MDRLHNEQNRAKAAKANRDNGTLKAKWANDQTFRARLLEHLKDLNQNPEVRARAIASLKQRYATDPDLRERNRRHLEKARAESNRRPNKPETQLQQVLDAEYPHQWKYTGDGKLIIGGYNPDFANCNGRKLLIELFGDYWHTKKADKWSDTELGRVMAFNSLGFRCLVIWEHELGDPEEVVLKIRRFMQGGRGDHSNS
jgi:very-short-patch-repair endonuclease